MSFKQQGHHSDFKIESLIRKYFKKKKKKEFESRTKSVYNQLRKKI